MDLNLQITDMAGARPEHSTVIVNFVSAIRKQLMNSTCYVFSDNIQYRFKTDEGEDKTVIPDAPINCRIKSRRGGTLIDAPRFVMEVLSESTEKYDRGEKWSCIDNRRLMNTGLSIGGKNRLRYTVSTMTKRGNRNFIR